MKAFLSSVITGFEVERDAAAAAIDALGFEVIRAEDFGASAGSPQVACLSGVRDADIVVLVLGERYGPEQASGLSATHEEYREARDHKDVLAFVQGGISPEHPQAAFIDEVRSWERGHFTAPFNSPADLQTAVTRELHRHVVNATAGPSDASEVLERATALVTWTSQSYGASNAELAVAISGGPLQSILRPAEIERADLHTRLLAHALTGPAAILTPASGTETIPSSGAVTLLQQGIPGTVRVTETGDLLLVQPITERTRSFSGIQAIIQEQVQQRLTRALRLGALLLDDIDPTNRLSDVAIVATLRGTGHMPWRTQAEQDQSPNSATMGGGRGNGVIATLSPPVRRRPALAHDTQALAEDLTVRLRQAQTQR